MVEEILHGQALSFLEGYSRSSGKGPSSPGPFQPGWESDFHFRELRKEYHRLFLDPQGASISLAESFYKPWTQDPLCHLPFGREKGFLLGDSALHMQALFENLGLEVPEEFRACPDHLALEMEFLSLLYRWSADRAIKRFIEDHLDWLPQLKEKLSEAQAHPVYAGAVEALGHFLDQERRRLTAENTEK